MRIPMFVMEYMLAMANYKEGSIVSLKDAFDEVGKDWPEGEEDRKYLLKSKKVDENVETNIQLRRIKQENEIQSSCDFLNRAEIEEGKKLTAFTVVEVESTYTDYEFVLKHPGQKPSRSL